MQLCDVNDCFDFIQSFLSKMINTKVYLHLSLFFIRDYFIYCTIPNLASYDSKPKSFLYSLHVTQLQPILFNL